MLIPSRSRTRRVVCTVATCVVGWRTPFRNGVVERNR